MNKCKLCGDSFTDLEDLYAHYEEEHGDAIPKDYSPAQFHYYLRTGKSEGSCVVCKKETNWNDSTNKYHRFCGRPACKKKYVDEFRKRMIGAHGRVHLLNDPDQQRKMLANRSISGEYIWSDNKKIPFTGSYEKDFLQFLDVFMGYESEDIMAPSPHTYTYMHEGVERFYIPDFFIPSLNLEIEVKDGGDNPNNHHKIQEVDKVKEQLKDKVMLSQKQFSYIKIINKKYEAFFDFLNQKKKMFASDGNADKPVFILESVVDSKQETVVTESIGDITLDEIDNKRKSGHYNLFHVSEDDLDGVTLQPRIPNNFMVKHGFENDVNRRVSFSGTIDGCLMGMSQNLKGKILHVYVPEDMGKVNTHVPSSEEVPDAHLTNEIWVTNPVRLKYDRTIRVGEAFNKPHTYTYGVDKKASLYRWNWVEVEKPITESSRIRTDSHKYPVYVILTHSGTTLSNIIKKVTKNPYSHASISFSPELNSMYSFGRKYKDNPFVGTFVKEDINAGLYGDVKDTATYSLYVTWVSEEERDAMMSKLSEFTNSTTPFKYNFTGLMKHQLGVESHRQDAYFCSEFVDTILKSGSTYFDKHSSLVKPYDFAQNKKFSFVTRGLLKGYSADKVNSLIKLMNGGKN